jgi:prophage regulatory protein
MATEELMNIQEDITSKVFAALVALVVFVVLVVLAATVPAATVPIALATLAVPAALRLIKMPEVRLKTGLSDSKIYAEISKGRLKPPVPLGPNSVAWVEAEVDEYIRDRIAERDEALARAAAEPKAEITRRPGRPQRSIWHSNPKSTESATT